MRDNLEVEQTPLMGAMGGPRGARRLMFLFFFLFVLTCVTTVVFAVLYAKEKNIAKNIPPGNNFPPNTAYDRSNDFPIKPLGPWDITQNHPTPLTFTTSQGTWMNLDVSPDGSTIVFDMLGDIYTLPIGGGQATLLRGGVAFEVQPRYSPDGNRLLFTSDQDGLDNIWVMDLSTKAQFQVTHEPYHFVSNAFWINQSTIVASKWYTSTRSIAAGEVWAYTVDSQIEVNKGTQLVGRQYLESQVGPEEPIAAASASNTTVVYYSLNVMDGSYWNYNKDPHQTIYAIFQYDTTTGETSTVAYEAGGSARPIVSHSGSHLAYIRRTFFQTSLVLLDVVAGDEVILNSNLDFDQQESSAPSGVYPRFAFTPDDSAIIIWAKGNLYSISTSTGVATQISFNVDVSLQLSPTARFPQQVADPETFNTKVVQYPAMSDDKSTFAFTSLATTYVYKPESGNGPAPLYTPDEGTFQFWPSFSQDGKYLVHVLWNDTSLSTVEVVSLSDLSRHTVPAPPGRYYKPRFSPSGDSVMYVRQGGDSLSGSVHSVNPGVYTHTMTVNEGGSISFGSPTFVTSGAYSAEYTNSGESIYAVSGSYPVSVTQVSTSSEMLGKPLGSPAFGLYTTEIVISPDMKYVAFVEFWGVYVAPFAEVRNENPMNVTSRGAGLTSAIFNCSYAGQYLQWSYDSKTLYWVWGPQIFELAVPDLTRCSDSSCISNNLKIHNVSVAVASDVVPSAQYVVFDDVTLLTMVQVQDIIPNARLVVQGDTIYDMGPSANVSIPQGATVYHMNGTYIMPGFIDAHAHWNGAWDSNFKVKADWEMMVNLAFGVTTMHNPSADSLSVFADAELIRSGKKIGPRVFSTGRIVYGAGGDYHCEITSKQDAINYLSALNSVGAWSAKSYNQPRRSSRQMILEAARELQMNVVPEGGMAYYWNLNQIIDGHTTIEHAIPVAPLYNDVITLFAKSGTAWTPTLIVNYGGIFGERYWFQHQQAWDNERLLMYVPESVVLPATMRYVGAQDQDYHQFATSRSVAQVYLNGGMVEAGAHGEMQGIGIHWEMLMFNQSALLSTYEVLMAATINSARALGIDQQVGSLQKGKLADLVFYNATNVLETLDTANIAYVMKNGNLYEAPSLNQVYPTSVPRPPLPILNTPVV